MQEGLWNEAFENPQAAVKKKGEGGGKRKHDTRSVHHRNQKKKSGAGKHKEKRGYFQGNGRCRIGLWKFLQKSLRRILKNV